MCGPATTGRRSEVLVVDDVADVLDLLGCALPDRGLAVRTAGSGPEAVQAYRAHGHGPGLVGQLVLGEQVHADGRRAPGVCRQGHPGSVACVALPVQPPPVTMTRTNSTPPPVTM